MYKPELITIQPEELPPQLRPALEQIASQVHDTWAAGRIEEGWTYGPQLDKEAKTHPSLLPYDQLPASEQEFDRQTAARTIHCLLEMGYTICKVNEEEK